MNWLLDKNSVPSFIRAYSDGFTPSAVQYEVFEREGGAKKLYTREGSTAVIPIHGVLTRSPDIFAWLFGGGNTTYGEIANALAQAENDDKVSDIVFDIDSPGGEFDGMFSALLAMRDASKPSTAFISGIAASAAYALACQADTIIASNIGVRVGSVGVVATYYVSENEVAVTSTAAPNKRPDVTTDEGKAAVREELDAMHQIFVDAIATARKTTAVDVNATFGQGSTVLANEAVKRGMIDSIQSGKEINSNEDTQMDLVELKSKHASVYAQTFTEGVESERDRCVAHLTMGAESGAIKVACDAVKEGTLMTLTMQSQYMAAGMSKRDIEARIEDADTADAADGVTSDDAQTSDADEVARLVESKLGV